jgi:hypothetical protein
MNLWKTLRERFSPAKPHPEGPPPLRNRPGGLAWINREIDCGEGSAALRNRVVTTTWLKDGDLWAIDPPQAYVLTRDTNFANGYRAAKGDTVTAIGIRDCCLTPIPGVRDDAQDESARWLPPVPAGKVSEKA